MSEKPNKMSNKARTIITVLAVLLLCSIVALVFRVFYLNSSVDRDSTVIVPDNQIGKESETTPVPETASENSTAGAAFSSLAERTSSDGSYLLLDSPSSPVPSASGTADEAAEEGATIELYKSSPSDNEKFQAASMLPGDVETKYYTVKISHHSDVTVHFNAVVTEQEKAYANILHITVTHLDNGKILYNGTFAGLDPNGSSEVFAAADSTETVAHYRIDVSLPTNTGNEYQAAKLLADFKWYVKAEDAGALDKPATGDTANLVWPAAVMIGALLLLVILLLFSRRRAKGDEPAKLLVEPVWGSYSGTADRYSEATYTYGDGSSGAKASDEVVPEPSVSPVQTTPTQTENTGSGSESGNTGNSNTGGQGEPITVIKTEETYTVEQGDTLEAIAAKYNTTVEKLMELNNLTEESEIQVGQVLKIPVS